MSNIQKYVTWKPKQVNSNLYEHPCTNDRVNKETNWQIIFTETRFQLADWRYVSFLEHDWNIVQEQLDNWKVLDPAFEFTIITEEEANILLNELGDITVSNFEFIDNRPVLDI